VTVDELAARVGLTVRTTRYYAGLGLLPPPVRRGRIAWYGAEHVARLELIRALQDHGFTLAAIERYLADGLELYDFLAGDGDYKRMMATHARTLNWLTVRRPGWRLALETLGVLVGKGSSQGVPIATLAPGGVVALRDISVATVCPHHLMPGLGRANVVYKPGARVLGLGAIARLVDACARRLALQETIAEDVVKALLEHAGARGAYCEVTLVHGCLSARGACQANARATSIARAGELSETEVLLALGRGAGA